MLTKIYVPYDVTKVQWVDIYTDELYQKIPQFVSNGVTHPLLMSTEIA